MKAGFQKKGENKIPCFLIGLVNDELGLLAALLGTLFIVWGKPIADPLAALFVATIIAVSLG